MDKIKRIGVLTSGGDAPGMNAAVRAVVRTAIACGIECIGIRRGWQGLITSDFVKLSSTSVGHILSRGGTILYTARSNDFMTEAGRKKAVATCNMLGLNAIGAIGAADVCEVLWLAASSLSAIRPEFVLDVSHLGLIGAALESVPADAQKALLSAIGEKNPYGVADTVREYGIDPEKIIMSGN